LTFVVGVTVNGKYASRFHRAIVRRRAPRLQPGMIGALAAFGKTRGSDVSPANVMACDAPQSRLTTASSMAAYAPSPGG
ncbi:MAG: hypothetical protein ACE5EF_03825, partial [Dehalococcoidia bacterium]